jgi:hypothetical protein
MSNQYGPKIITDSLVLCLDPGNVKSYPGSGTAWNDLSGNGNNGTLVNGVGYSGSNLGVLSFDGVNDYVSLNDSNSLTNTSTLTINCWVRIISFGAGFTAIIGKGTNDSDEEYCVLLSSASLYFDVGNNAGPYVQTSYTFNINTWYNICCIHSRPATTSTLSAYVNGILLNSTTLAATNTPNNNSLPVSIGSRFYNSINGPLNGSIAQISIYNRVLTAAEVQQNYNALKGRFSL